MSLPPTQSNPNPNPNGNIRSRSRSRSLPEIWLKEQAQIRQAKMKMNQNQNQQVKSPEAVDDVYYPIKTPAAAAADYTSLLPDTLLLRIFSYVPTTHRLESSLVCKRWCSLLGRLVHSLNLCEWSFLRSGRIFRRFPNLTEIDLTRACVTTTRNSGILLSSPSIFSFSIHLGTTHLETSSLFDVNRDLFLSPDTVDMGLGFISENYPSLRRVVVIGPGEVGLFSVADKCETLQEIELHCCDDTSLKGITKCRNLQVVKLMGKVDGFYDSVVSDIGLTILAHGCSRLVKLELCGCEGSYDGIKAIGQCCFMLEELSLWDHRMDGGWLSALSFCGNLKTLRLVSCKGIDDNPGLEEHLGRCLALEELRLERCRLGGQQKDGVKALFLVCEAVRDLVLKDCWGLEDEVFEYARVCRRVKFLSLEGCSLLTTSGLESVILTWSKLQGLIVVSCNKIKDGEVSPELASLFSDLKELKWRPDSRSLLSSGLEGTGIGNKGGRFFKV